MRSNALSITALHLVLLAIAMRMQIAVFSLFGESISSLTLDQNEI